MPSHVYTTSLACLVVALPALAAGQGRAAPAAKAAQAANVVSFASGATVVTRPSEYGDTYTALMLLDESAQSIWASEQNVTTNQRIVIALGERSELTAVVFDTGGIDGDGRGAKDVVVEVSDEGPTAGFAPIATVTLADKADGQRFPVTAARPGRWIALTIKNNHGAADYVELGEFRGEGRALATTAPAAIAGSYETKWPGGSAAMHLRQDGSSVTGCYVSNEGVLAGGLEGRVLRFVWHEGRDGGNYGPAIMVISPDGTRLNGLWWHGDKAEGQASWWDGVKVGAAIGSCPHWKPDTALGMALERDLRESKRSRLYGITFDFGSDRIRPDSKATLDQVIAVLKTNADWKVTVEGHTDNVGGDAPNQALSDRRATAVKTYLTTAGIDAARLTATGFGAKQPVATNDSDLGRAQNRRVELVRQ